MEKVELNHLKNQLTLDKAGKCWCQKRCEMEHRENSYKYSRY